MLTNHAKVMQFFDVSNGVTGRKKMQKMIYILQKCHIPFEEKYEFYVYGPYSEELALRVEELCNLGFLEEEKEDKRSYYQYHYEVTESGKSFLQQFSVDMPDIKEKAEMLKEKSSRFLELVATMFYFDDYSTEEMVQKVHKVKPKQKYTETEITESLTFMNHLKQA